MLVEPGQAITWIHLAVTTFEIGFRPTERNEVQVKQCPHIGIRTESRCTPYSVANRRSKVSRSPQFTQRDWSRNGETCLGITSGLHVRKRRHRGERRRECEFCVYERESRPFNATAKDLFESPADKP